MSKDKVQEILNHINPDTKDKNGETALIWAVKNGQTEIAQTLIAIGVDLNAKDKDGNTALIWAAKNGQTDIVQTLIAKGAMTNVQDKDGNTAFSLAMDNMDVEIIQALLAKKTVVKIGNMNNHRIQVLAKALESNTSVTTLELHNNGINDQGAQALAKMLKHNTTITHLDLTRNYIESKGAQALAEMLKHNTTITHLDLTRNYIESKGIQALAEALQHNTTITGLNLNLNYIGSHGDQALLKALKHNTTIIQLNTSQRGFELQKYVKRNNDRFNMQCEEILRGAFDKFSLKDIQTFTTILNATIINAKSANASPEEMARYIKIKERSNQLFYPKVHPIIGNIGPLPPEMIAKISSYLVPSDINLSTNSEQLIRVVTQGDINTTQQLLAKGIDPNYKNKYGVTALSSRTSPQIKRMLREASSVHKKLDGKAMKHIKSALKEVSTNRNTSSDEIFAEKKIDKHISKDLFTKQAQQIRDGMKLTFVEKVKSVFQGRDEVVSQKAMKQLKDNAGYKEVISAKVKERHDKQQQRQHNIMKEFMPASNVFTSLFLEYDDKGGMAKIVSASDKNIREMSKAVKDGITDYIKEKSNKSLTSKEQKTLESNLLKAYQQLAREIRQNIPAEKLNTQQDNAGGIVLKAAKESSFGKAMEDINSGKKPELPKGSAAALFVEAIKPLTLSTFKDKVTAETSGKSHQQRG